MTGDPLAGRAWWDWMAAEDRELYADAGYMERQRIQGKACLLVIDVTMAFTGTRPLPIREAAKEYPTSAGQAAWDALPGIELLLEAFRAAQLPVVFTNRDVAGQQAIGQTATKRAGTGDAADGTGFLPSVAPRPGEWVCVKTRASAMYGTPLQTYLLRHGVTTLVICGGLTCTCVRATATDAYSAGFQVLVVEDGCFDRTRQQHLANLFDINAKFGTVLTAAEVRDQLA